MAGNESDRGDPIVSICVSGGGHRASAWAIGVVQAVVDADLGTNLTSLISVSGGSITNAVLADRVDLRSTTRGELDRATADLREAIATKGLFMPGPHTNGYTSATLGVLCVLTGVLVAVGASVIAAGRGHHTLWWLLAGAPALAAIALPVSKPPVPSANGWLAMTALTMSVGGWTGSAWTSTTAGWNTVLRVCCLGGLLLALAWIATGLLSSRGRMVVRALDKAFFDGRSLADVGPDDQVPTVDHVFATTDLESADALYLAPRFVASYRRGITTPDGVTLAEAAQASAALPGGFPPTILRVSNDFRRPWVDGEPRTSVRSIPVSDGGAYDNMGDQWDARRSRRMKEWGDLIPEGLGPQPTLLIVANASAPWEREPWTAKTSFGRELASLKRTQGIQYDQTTAARRSGLFSQFHAALRTGEGLRGVILMIDRTPFQVCDAHIDDEDVHIGARAVEARAALAEVGGCEDYGCDHDRDAQCAVRQAWKRAASVNGKVPTTLGAIGVHTTDAILIQSRTMTVTSLYVLHGLARIDQLEPPPPISLT